MAYVLLIGANPTPEWLEEFDAALVAEPKKVDQKQQRLRQALGVAS